MGRKAGLLSLSVAQGKTFFLDADTILVEDGHNIRALDEEHARTFAESFSKGDHVPPILVKVTDEGARLVAGQHRLAGYKLALSQGVELKGIECQEFKGGADEEIAVMLRENGGKNLTGLEVATAFQRLQRMEWDINKIAEAVGMSRSYVEKYLILAEATEPVKNLVNGGTISVSTAVEFVRAHGDNAHEEITKQLAKQAGLGGNSGARRAPIQSKPKFPAKKALRLLELIGEDIRVLTSKPNSPIFEIHAELEAAKHVEFNELLEDYLDFCEHKDDI